MIVEWTRDQVKRISRKAPNGVVVKELLLLPGRNVLTKEDWELVRLQMSVELRRGLVRVVEEKKPEPSPPRELKKPSRRRGAKSGDRHTRSSS